MAEFPEPALARNFEDMRRNLPPLYSDESLSAQIRAEIERSRRKVVVLDDDPTGPQAMSDVYTLTGWSVEALYDELLQPRPLFFVLTNTRALSTARAVARVREIAAAVREAARQADVPYTLMIRGDSTLRGHFPAEENALGAFDGRILLPFFPEGGRYTVEDVQWVAETGPSGPPLLIPAALTPYARDSAFGYRHSNLRNWVEEKSHGADPASSTLSVSLEHLRSRGPDAVCDSLILSRRQTTILNAMDYRDLEVAALGLLCAEQTGMRFIVRCAASFVRVRAGQSGAADLDLATVLPAGSEGTPNRNTASRGGLIVVGSHVPNTSAQLQMLLQERDITACELSVAAVQGHNTAHELNRISQRVNAKLGEGRTVVVYTSREVEPRGTEAGLAIGAAISSALVEIVRRLETRPRFMVGKGGWTSSEIGICALRVKRAYSPAPILPGVPLWLLGPESSFPGMPYVIFPGNVGDSQALVSVVRRLSL